MIFVKKILAVFKQFGVHAALLGLPHKWILPAEYFKLNKFWMQ